MERRKFVIGAGALATGSAAAMGTGAFSSAQADRSVNVSVADDSNAYVELNKLDDRFVDDSDGQLSIEFDEEGDGEGLNQDSTFEFTDLFSVGIADGLSTGTEYWVGVVPTGFGDLDGDRPVRVYANDDDGSPEQDGEYYNLNGEFPASISADPQDQPETDLITLTAGESFDVSLQINTAEVDGEGELHIVAIEKGGNRDET